MEKYRKVIKPKGADEEAKEDEVRITQKGKVRNSISYVTTLFEVRYVLVFKLSRRAHFFVLGEKATTSYIEGHGECDIETCISG